MDWIKKNYDRLLLGVFGLLALVIGGCQSFKAFTTATADQPQKVKDDRYDAGKYKTAQAVDAQKAIGVEVKWGPVVNGHEKARLFVAAPIVEKGGDTPPFKLLAPDAPQLHAPVPNWFFYENDIDYTLSDAKISDADVDLFTNEEEFLGSSNPRDPTSKPPITMKLVYVKQEEDKYEIRFSGLIKGSTKTDLQIRREFPLGPDGRRKMSSLQYHVGDMIFEDDKRFKIISAAPRPVAGANGVVQLEHLVLEDTLNPGTPPLVIPVRTTLNVPSFRARVKSSLSGEEVVVKPGEEIKLKDFPSIKFILKTMSPEWIEIEYVEPGKPNGTAKIPKSGAEPAPAPAPDAASAAPPAGGTSPSTTPPTPSAPTVPSTGTPATPPSGTPATPPATPPTTPPSPTPPNP